MSKRRVRAHFNLTHLAVNPRLTGCQRYALELLRAFRRRSHGVEVLHGVRNNSVRFCERAERRLRRLWPDAVRGRFTNRVASFSLPPHAVERAMELVRAAGDPFGLLPGMRRKRLRNRERMSGAFAPAPADVDHEIFGVLEYSHLRSFAGKYLMTVHDILPVTRPEFFPKWLSWHFGRAFDAVWHDESVYLLCSSRATRDEAVACGVDPRRCFVVPLGVSDYFRPLPPPAVDAALRRLSLERGRFVLTVATLEPRKNLVTLLEAYAALRPAERRLAGPLVLVGATGWAGEKGRVRRAARRLGGGVVFAGHVDDDSLRALYCGASLFAYVPYCEGFGLPPLEAMACGTPVVTSEASSLPEAVGDAALRVPPEDPAAVAAALRRGLSDARLRESLRRRGLARARRFTWDRTAALTAAVYRRILSDK